MWIKFDWYVDYIMQAHYMTDNNNIYVYRCVKLFVNPIEDVSALQEVS
jgi:hypothetical protein